MPTSKKQIKSNRENAQKSTGPKTEQGKAIAAKNSIRHGLYAKDIVVNSPNLREDENEFKQFLSELYDDFSPVGLMEKYLVDKMANALWRCRRAARAETGIVNRQLRRVRNFHFVEVDWSDEEEQRDTDDLALINLIPGSHQAGNILRYEMCLDRQFTRAYALLTSIQARRHDDMMLDRRDEKPLMYKTNPDPAKQEGDNILQENLEV